MLAGGKRPLHHVFRMAEEPERIVKSLRRAAAMTGPAWMDGTHSCQTPTHFSRPDLSRILAIYGRMVAAGEWRDYALDFLPDAAVFSIFRRTSEMALFRIEKRPALRARQGQYAVIAAGGLMLKRGHDLAQVLKVFDKKLLKVLKGR